MEFYNLRHLWTPHPSGRTLSLLCHLYPDTDLNYHCDFFFFKCTIVTVIEVLRPITTIHHQQPVGLLHESDSLIPSLNYCLNEQETRTALWRHLHHSLARSLSVFHPSPSVSLSVFQLLQPAFLLGFPFCLQLCISKLTFD